MSIREVFAFSEKYEMDLIDAFALRKALVIGVIAVEKCVMLGLGEEIRKDFEEKIDEMIKNG